MLRWKSARPRRRNAARTAETVLSEIGRLDPAAIAEVRDDAWPDIRDAEELHDALLTLVALPVPAGGTELSSNSLQTKLRESVPQWVPHFEQLVAGDARVLQLLMAQATGCPRTRRRFRKIYPSATFDAQLPNLASTETTTEDAQLAIIRGWMMHAGPVSATQITNVLPLAPAGVERVLLHLETVASSCAENSPIPSPLKPNGANAACWRAIHRLTLGQLRKQVESVTPAQFMNWLFRWQHVAPSSQLLRRTRPAGSLRNCRV